MNEQQLRDLIAAVKAGDVSRRAFVRRMVGLGLTAPFAAMLLHQAGVAAEPRRQIRLQADQGGRRRQR